MSPPTSSASQLGQRIGEYPGSSWRYFWVVVWAIMSVWCVIGNLPQGNFGGVLFGLALGAGCYLYYVDFFPRTLSARLFERGFVIERNGKTTEVRWADIANVEHRRWRLFMYFVIPVTLSDAYIVTLTNGVRVKVTTAFKQQNQLGSLIHRKWLEAIAARAAMHA